MARKWMLSASVTSRHSTSTTDEASAGALRKTLVQLAARFGFLETIQA